MENSTGGDVNPDQDVRTTPENPIRENQTKRRASKRKAPQSVGDSDNPTESTTPAQKDVQDSTLGDVTSSRDTEIKPIEPLQEPKKRRASKRIAPKSARGSDNPTESTVPAQKDAQVSTGGYANSSQDIEIKPIEPLQEPKKRRTSSRSARVSDHQTELTDPDSTVGDVISSQDIEMEPKVRLQQPKDSCVGDVNFSQDNEIEPIEPLEEPKKTEASPLTNGDNLQITPEVATRRSSRKKWVASKLTNGDYVQIEPTMPTKRSNRKKPVASQSTTHDDVQIEPTVPTRSREEPVASQPNSDAQLQSVEEKPVASQFTDGDDVQIKAMVSTRSSEEPIASQPTSDAQLQSVEEEPVASQPTTDVQLRSVEEEPVATQFSNGDGVQIEPTVTARGREEQVPSQPTSDTQLQSAESIHMVASFTTDTKMSSEASMEDSTMVDAHPFDDLHIEPIEPLQVNSDVQLTHDIALQIEPPVPLRQEAHCLTEVGFLGDHALPQKLIVSQPTGDVSNSFENDVTATFTTEQVFNSRAELSKWVRDIGKTVGTIIVINKSDKGYPGKKPRIVIGCERGGSYNQKGTVSRHTESKKCGCPFLLKGVKMPKDDQWMLNVACGFHNHPVRENVENHSYAKTLPLEEKKVLKEMVKRGAKPKEVINALKERNVQDTLTLKTVYNARTLMKSNELSKRSQMKELLKKVLEYEYPEWHTSHEDGSISDLIWAHPESIKLAKCFPHVFLMHAYEQSKYTLPVIEIVGVTSTNKTFSFAFVYLETKEEDNYVWAFECIKSILNVGMFPLIFVTDKEVHLMSAIKRVFPEARNLFCRDLIVKDLATNCKKMFNGYKAHEPWNLFLSKWNELVFSSTEEEYFARLSAFEGQFSEYSRAVSYVKEVWLSEYKERFIAAWTNKSLHFGNTTTKREDNSQARLKRYLGSSLGSFNTVWTAIVASLLLQHTEVKASFNESLNTVINEHTSVTFNELRGSVSIFALDLILGEVKIADSVGPDDGVCGCVIRHSHGLPCSHEISRYKRDGLPIPLSSIHSHWIKLSTVPPMGPNKVFELESLFRHICRKFEETDESGEVEIMKKLTEIAGENFE